MNQDALVGKVCSYNKAISDPSRMKMIKILGSHDSDTLKVTDIAQMLGISQPAATKHLKVMEQAGIFDRKRVGTSVYYSLHPGAIEEYRSALQCAFTHVDTKCKHEYKCDDCPVSETCM